MCHSVLSSILSATRSFGNVMLLWMQRELLKIIDFIYPKGPI